MQGGFGAVAILMHRGVALGASSVPRQGVIQDWVPTIQGIKSSIVSLTSMRMFQVVVHHRALFRVVVRRDDDDDDDDHDDAA